MNLTEAQLERVHAKNNCIKSVQTLMGILQGICADKVLNEAEVLFLSIWIQENQYLRNDADAIDILDCITDIHRTKHPTFEQIEDLKELITQIIEYRLMDESTINEHAQANILHGLINGIMADSNLLDTEIKALNNWLNTSDTQEWPASIISNRVKNVLADGIITEAERENLSELLKQCGANLFTETGAASSTTIQLGVSEPEAIDPTDRTFCFTGNFISGTREACHEIVVSRGGRAAKSITKKLHYLVLGHFPSRDWITSSYGRKIQQAIQIKEAGHGLMLLTEHAWAKALKL